MSGLRVITVFRMADVGCISLDFQILNMKKKILKRGKTSAGEEASESKASQCI